MTQRFIKKIQQLISREPDIRPVELEDSPRAQELLKKITDPANLHSLEDITFSPIYTPADFTDDISDLVLTAGLEDQISNIAQFYETLENTIRTSHYLEQFDLRIDHPDGVPVGDDPRNN